MRSRKRVHERLSIEQRFLEMNKHIGELTSMVRALTVKGTNSREEDDQKVYKFGTSVRSDMVTGVSAKSTPIPILHQLPQTLQYTRLEDVPNQ